MPASRAIAMSKVESPTMMLSRRFRTGLGERLLEHRRMRFRGMIVGGLDGREDAGPAMAVEEMRDPRRDFPVAMPSSTSSRARRELGEKLGRALEQRLAVGRVGAQALEGGLVALGKAFGRAVGSEHAERLEERQPDDRERALAARRLEAVRPEGRALRCDDQILAVDERAVDVNTMSF